jgi:hypothetical protein
MTVIMKAAGPADLLAMVPTLTRFRPQNSLVVLMFRGKRTCGAIRFDLPATSTPAVLKRLATYVVGTMCKIPAIDGAVPIVYTDERIVAGSTLPRDDYVRVIEKRLHYSGLRVKDLLCVGANGWASYFDPDRPDDGHPLAEIADSQILEGVPEEMREIGTLGGTLAEVTEEERAQFAAQLAVLDAFMDSALSTCPEEDDDVPPEISPLADLVQLFEDAIFWTDSEIDRWGPLLMFAIQSPGARDTAMLQWATRKQVGSISLDLHPLPADQGGATALADSPRGRFIGDLMLGIGPRPNPGRVDAAIELLRRLTPLLDEPQQLAPLCMLTWLNWALGHGSAAGDYLDRAVAIDPKYGMAEVLGTMLGNGIMAEWAFDVPSPGTARGGSMGR